MEVLRYSVLFFSFAIICGHTKVINVSPDSSSIQDAINLSQDGDTILVEPGIYYENINFSGKKIVVGSLYLTTGIKNHINHTVINGNKNGSVVTFWSGEDSSSVLIGFTISNGFSNGGAGIYSYLSSPCLDNLIISDNVADYYGGGIYLYLSQPILKSITVANNFAADKGGGIFIQDSEPVFLQEYRSNIYLNHSRYGSDLFLGSTYNNTVFLDTFTVLDPTEYQAIPIDNYTFDIKNAKVKQVTYDLFVSPEGDDNNNGSSEDESLKTIFMALIKIKTDSLNPQKIFLDTGIYSKYTNNERFPVKCRSDVSLQGIADTLTIIDADSFSCVLFCQNINNLNIENITLQNGSGEEGGGIYSENSEISLKNVQILKNDATTGGGISCTKGSRLLFDTGLISENACLSGIGGGIYVNNSIIKLYNLNITDNICGQGGGIHFLNDNGSELYDVNIIENTATNSGGALYCFNSSPTFYRVSINNNKSKFVGAIQCTICSCPKFINSTFYYNKSEDSYYGFINQHDQSNLFFLNSILWNNIPEYITSSSYARRNTVTITYSNIEGGQSSFKRVSGDTLNWLEGNIYSNPEFLLFDNGLVGLSENSPCVDSGTDLFIWKQDTILNLSNSMYNGNAPDMGAVESDFSTNFDFIDIELFGYELCQNFPNPFNSETIISYQLSASMDVELSVYSLIGQKIITLVKERQNPGKHKIKFNASGLASGVYLYCLNTKEFTKSRKMLLLR